MIKEHFNVSMKKAGQTMLSELWRELNKLNYAWETIRIVKTLPLKTKINFYSNLWAWDANL